MSTPAPKTERLGEIEFEVTPLGLEDAIDAFERLAKTAGPALALIADGRGKPFAFGPVVAEAVGKISAADLKWAANLFGKHTRFSRDGQAWPYLDKANREGVFAGDLPLFFRWLAFAIEANFAGFFEALGPVMRGVDPRASTPPR